MNAPTDRSCQWLLLKVTFCPAHLARPLLPLAWHARTRTFLDDIATISAIYDVEIYVRVMEKLDGDLLASASMPRDVTEEVHSFESSACAHENDVVPFFSVICGEVESCALRFHNGASSVVFHAV